jgi:hypothetical protein
MCPGAALLRLTVRRRLHLTLSPPWMGSSATPGDNFGLGTIVGNPSQQHPEGNGPDRFGSGRAAPIAKTEWLRGVETGHSRQISAVS